MKLKGVIWVVVICLAIVAIALGKSIFQRVGQLAITHPSLEPPALATPTPQSSPPTSKFSPTMRGCGPSGYIQAYELPDGLKMSEGTDCFDTRKEARKQFHQKLLQASQVIERDSAYQCNRYKGEVIDRVVVLFAQAGEQPSRVEIVYLHGKCLAEIRAPSLSLALEFEKMEAWAF
jgi:hypothetical protein